MHIDHIHIENFKGIHTRDIRFNPHFTVLIGDNGTGKSSILDAVSIAIGTILMRTGAPFGLNGSKSRALLQREVRKVMVSAENVEKTDVLLSGEFIYQQQPIAWSRSQSKSSTTLGYREATALRALGKNFADRITEDIDLPLFAYHSTARLAGEIYGRQSYEKMGSRLDGYYACLDPRSIKQKFVSWFKTFEDAALKFNKDKALYDAFVQAITAMVPAWKDIKFHWGLDEMLGRTDEDNWLPLSHLSDGYRSIIRLTADLAYRCIKLNPHLGTRSIQETSGIVLIDEIDMHLHPKWQRHIVSDLKKTFPGLQFIATTHSPFIVQSLQADEVFNLDSNVLPEHPNTLSLAENALFMGVDSVLSAEIEQKGQIAFDYLSELQKGESNSRLAELQSMIERTSDPVFRAKLRLEHLALTRGE